MWIHVSLPVVTNQNYSEVLHFRSILSLPTLYSSKYHQSNKIFLTHYILNTEIKNAKFIISKLHVEIILWGYTTLNIFLKLSSPVFLLFFKVAPRKFYITHVIHICILHYISVEEVWFKQLLNIYIVQISVLASYCSFMLA